MGSKRRESDRFTVRDGVTLFLALMFLAGGVALFVVDIRESQRHIGHLSLALGMAIFGAALLNPDPIIDRLARLAHAGRGFLPWAKQDPPPPPSAGPG
jgi:uncharacterized membrane protein